MKKNKVITIFLFLFLFLPISVNAEGLCTSTKFNKLKKEAFEAQLVYELNFDKEHNSYFTVDVYNVGPDVMMIFNSNIYLPDKDGHIALESVLQGGGTYEFKFYGGYQTDCVEEYVYSKKLKIPKYNPYSEREECIEYEEFPLCNKWYKVDIDSPEYFEEQLENYISSLRKDEPKKEEEVIEKSIIEKIIDFYVKNILQVWESGCKTQYVFPSAYQKTRLCDRCTA